MCHQKNSEGSSTEGCLTLVGQPPRPRVSAATVPRAKLHSRGPSTSPCSCSTWDKFRCFHPAAAVCLGKGKLPRALLSNQSRQSSAARSGILRPTRRGWGWWKMARASAPPWDPTSSCRQISAFSIGAGVSLFFAVRYLPSSA